MAEVFDSDLYNYLDDRETEDFFDKADRLYQEKRDRELEDKELDNDENEQFDSN